MDEKICLITGGNAGIGRAAAVRLAKEGVRVVIACRHRARGEEALGFIREQSGSEAVELIEMDLSSRRSIAAGCETYRERHETLDVLIHNAADFDIGRKNPVYSEEGAETVWATNHIGPVLLTQQLMPQLLRSEQGRVITVASLGLVMHPFLRVSLEDPEFSSGGFRVDKAYYQSKLAQVMYTYWLADHLSATTVTVNCIRVPNVRIDIERYPNVSSLARRLYRIKSRFAFSPEDLAEVYVWMALSPELSDVSGKYFSEKKRIVSSGRYSTGAENIRRVMELTARYVPGLLEPPVHG